MGEKRATAAPAEASTEKVGASAPEGEKGLMMESPKGGGVILLEQPAPMSKLDITGWHAYSLCSFFVHTVLIPILFPLIIAQTTSDPSPSPSPDDDGRALNSRGISCLPKQIQLYQSLVTHSMTADRSRFSPLHWTAMSWAAGALLAKPALVPSAWSLDLGGFQPVLGSATVAGGFFCLLTGFFKTRWVFPIYIAVIAVADTVSGAAHGRHLGIMVRGRTAHLPCGSPHFERRRSLTSRLSLLATAAGSLGAAIIAAFTYHMLRRSDHHTSLWVVSIFSGLLWSAGVAHAFTAVQTGSTSSTAPRGARPDRGRLAHVMQICRYPHAVGSLVGIFLSSSSSTCIFISGILYVFGELCVKPVSLLSLWMIYFIFPVFSLPAVHLVQLVLRADAVRLQLLGFFMSAVTAGAGWYYRGNNWHRTYVLLAAVLQSTAAGTLHASGRALTVDCSPAGGEGAFSAWASWVRTAGACAGFALASGYPGDIGKTFGVSFCAVVLGSCVLVFGNVSHERGVEAAGRDVEEEEEEEEEGEEEPVVHGLDEKARQGRRSASEPPHDEKLESKDGIQQV